MREYSKIPVNYGMTGKDVAEKMLRDNGIYDVKVTMVPGELTDNYNPVNKTVNLSEGVYHGSNVSAAAVAAHECGHALQHEHEYAPLKLRTTLVPLQNVSARILNIIFIAMLFGAFTFGNIVSPQIAGTVIVGAYAIFTLFAFVTLPVEINATQRALAWLGDAGITQHGTHEKAENALRWAAYTYVVAALSSLSMLIYYGMMFFGGDD
jgi:Zn-dependent membrane protease YugP